MKLELHPTYIEVVDADKDVQLKLIEAFSWVDSKAQFMLKRHREKVHTKPMKWCSVCNWNGKSELYKDGKLAIGFQERLLAHLNEWGVEYEVADCKPPLPVRQYDWHYLRDLRPYQQDILEAMLDCQYGVIEAATGAGKTACAAAFICERGVPAIVLCPTKIIHGQFMDELKHQTDIPVGQIASGKYEEAPVQIAITKSLMDKDGRVKEEYLQDKQLIVVDEFHQSASNNYEKIINACPAYYRFGFSATPFRATDLECNMLTGIAGEVIAKIDTETLQEEGYLCASDIRMVPASVRYDRRAYDDDGELQDTTYADRYRQGIVENAERNQAIAEIVDYHSERQEKVLVIVSWTDHADVLLPMFPESTIYLSGHDTPKKTLEKRDQFRSQDGGVMIGSPVVDVGFDVPDCQVVIMAGAGSYDGRQRQRLGRGLRIADGKTVATIYDFLDDDRGTGGRPMFWQHSKARMQAYKDVGQAVTEYETVEAALGVGQNRLAL